VGTKIDIMSLNTFVGILFLLYTLPFKFTENKYYKNSLGYIWFIILALMLIINISDIIYFGFFYKHIDSTLIALNNDPSAVIGFVKVYIFQLFILLLFLVVFFKYWQKLIIRPIQSIKYKTSTLLFLITILFVLFGARGCKINDKPFNISDAYVTDKISGANLSISGFYSAYRNSYNISNKKQKVDFYPQNIAKQIVQSVLETNTTVFTNPDYPFQRAFKNNKPTKKYNVCIILVESLSSKFVDSFNGNIGLKVTPFIDSIASQSMIFTNAYANGRQSIDGIGAILAGVVAPANNNLYFGKGLEASKFSYLGSIFKSNGYKTIAMQSSKRNSFRVDSITRLAGFSRYYGAEDFKTHQHGEDKDKMPHYGTWDGDMFNRYFTELDKIQKPFLSFTFTSTTHFPFYLPNKKYEIYPHNKINLNGYLNTLKYTDDMLKDFFNKAKKTNWFKDTIFILLADHTAPMPQHNVTEFTKKFNIVIPNRMLERYKIPLIVYAPSIIKPKIVDNVVSQADIIPSLIDTLGFKSNFSTISNSIFNNSNQFALAKEGNIYTFITKDGYTIRRTDKLFKTKNKDYSKEILSLHQLFVDSLNKNKFYK